MRKQYSVNSQYRNQSRMRKQSEIMHEYLIKITKFTRSLFRLSRKVNYVIIQQLIVSCYFNALLRNS